MAMTQARWRQIQERYRKHRPGSRHELGPYIQRCLGIHIPDRQICGHHHSPMDYLADSLLRGDAGGDLIVWANRGGGKTQLGAAASLLECVWGAGTQVCILGGSRDQSRLMYGYVREFAERGYLTEVKRLGAGTCRFENGSRIEVLTQSQKSVRGKHVQRLRCDEVELFDREVWQASQFVTQSRGEMAGRMEMLSTLHEPYGLMSEIVKDANRNGARVYQWCLWEVIERCEGRSCGQCCLLEDCQERARQGSGYFGIDDAIAIKQRSSQAGWRAEMLCLEPQRGDVVFDEFDASVHVGPVELSGNGEIWWGMDFGYRNPLAALLIEKAGEQIRVVDEYIQSRQLLGTHISTLLKRWPGPMAVCCDPAGRQRNDITGTGPVDELRLAGFLVQSRPSRVLEGVELIRRALRPGAGRPRLIINPRCQGLIEALKVLRYDRLRSGARSELPDKDGVHDHVIDALRYYMVNREASGQQVVTARY